MVIAHNIAESGRAFHALLLLISDWGVAIVVASFLQIHIGFWFTGNLSLSPLFMGGLFVLAILSGIEKLNRRAPGSPKI